MSSCISSRRSGWARCRAAACWTGAACSRELLHGVHFDNLAQFPSGDVRGRGRAGSREGARRSDGCRPWRRPPNRWRPEPGRWPREARRRYHRRPARTRQDGVEAAPRPRGTTTDAVGIEAVCPRGLHQLADLHAPLEVQVEAAGEPLQPVGGSHRHDRSKRAVELDVGRIFVENAHRGRQTELEGKVADQASTDGIDRADAGSQESLGGVATAAPEQARAGALDQLGRRLFGEGGGNHLLRSNAPTPDGLVEQRHNRVVLPDPALAVMILTFTSPRSRRTTRQSCNSDMRARSSVDRPRARCARRPPRPETTMLRRRNQP